MEICGYLGASASGGIGETPCRTRPSSICVILPRVGGSISRQETNPRFVHLDSVIQHLGSSGDGKEVHVSSDGAGDVSVLMVVYVAVVEVMKCPAMVLEMLVC